MGNWVDYVNEVDQSTVEQQGVRYPYIQWVNGNPQLKALGGVPAMGGWFMPAEQAPNDEMQGWIKNVLTHSTGAETEGWFREVLTFAPIRSRRCWRVNAAGRSQMYPWNQYDEALKAGHPAGKLQVLAIVKEWLELIDVPLGKRDKDGEVLEYGVVTRHIERRAACLLFFEQMRQSLPEWPWPFRSTRVSGFFK